MKLGQRGCPGASRRSKRLGNPIQVLFVFSTRASNKCAKGFAQVPTAVSSDAPPSDNPSDRVSTPKVRRKARTNFPHIFQKLQTCRSRPILLRFGLTDSVCSSFTQTLRPKKTALQTDIHSGMSAKTICPTMCFAGESKNRKILASRRVKVALNKSVGHLSSCSLSSSWLYRVGPFCYEAPLSPGVSLVVT